jgi:hypothetical protein
MQLKIGNFNFGNTVAGAAIGKEVDVLLFVT